jgi:hypothetical protein
VQGLAASLDDPLLRVEGRQGVQTHPVHDLERGHLTSTHCPRQLDPPQRPRISLSFLGGSLQEHC